MDQISEHQRDLTNSASSRFVAEYFAGFALAAERMKSILDGLAPDKPGMAANLEKSGGKIQGATLAESAYILLADSGYTGAHEAIRKITLTAEETGRSFYDALRSNAEVYGRIAERLQALGRKADFFEDPANYCGLAAEKAAALAARYRGI
jgi:adenylosuccinate lyase